MKHILSIAAAIGLAAAATAPASADSSQLVASAGLTAAEAQGMSLTEIAAHKFNRDADRDDQQTVSVRSAPAQVDATRHAQLIASAKLSPEEAEGLTLNQIAAAKYNAGVSADERQGDVVMSSRGSGRAGAQLIAAAGLTASEARGLSLSEIAAYKFNRDVGRDDWQTIRD